MQKPEKCSAGFNLRRIGEPHERLRLLCLYAQNRKQIADMLRNAGGNESSGICNNHEEYAIWHARQEPTEEEKKRAQEREKRIKKIRARFIS